MFDKKVFLRRSTFWIFFGFIISCGFVLIPFFLLLKNIAVLAGSGISEPGDQWMMFYQKAAGYKGELLIYGLPTILGLFALVWIFIRWMIGCSFRKHVLRPLAEERAPLKIRKEKAPSEKPTEKIIYRVDKNREKLLYAHLLSSFQRQGRWVDFLFEKLDQYEDDQIGAAVRSIHENCRKVLDEHVMLKPVLDREYGDEITIAEGFPKESIQLIGNVQGSPPFTGIVRHKGWRIQKMDIPEFSSDRMLDILAPAEVEIQ